MEEMEKLEAGDVLTNGKNIFVIFKEWTGEEVCKGYYLIEINPKKIVPAICPNCVLTLCNHPEWRPASELEVQYLSDILQDIQLGWRNFELKFKPKKEDPYWFFGDGLSIRTKCWKQEGLDFLNWERGSIFPTRVDALRARNHVIALLQSL